MVTWSQKCLWTGDTDAETEGVVIHEEFRASTHDPQENTCSVAFEN